MSGSKSAVAVCVFALAGAFSGRAYPANPDFQDFFFDACVDPVAGLEARCNETALGLGDLSGDSESSLNPTQVQSSNDSALSAARSRSKELTERAERLREGEDTAAGPSVAMGRFSLLVNARGTWEESDLSQDDLERGYDSDMWSAEIGFDHRLSDRTVWGALLAFGEADLEFDAENEGVNFEPASSAGSIDRESTSLVLFGSTTFGQAGYVDFGIGYAWDEYDFERNSVFQESGRAVPQTNVITSGDADGEQYWLSVGGGYGWSRGANTLGLYGGLTYASTEVDSYTEIDLSNSGLNMSYDDFERTSLVSRLGVRISRASSFKGGVLVPQARVEWEHEFDRDAEVASAQYVFDAGENVYLFEGVDPDRDFFNVGVGLAVILPGGWMPFVDIAGVFGIDDYERYRLTAGLRREL